MILELTNNADKTISECSFCGAKEPQVLIAGAEGCICSDCLVAATGMLLDNTQIIEGLSQQYIQVQKKINRSFILILILLVIAFSIVTYTTIFKV